MNEFIKRHLWVIIIASLSLAGTWAIVRDRVQAIPALQADVVTLKTFAAVQVQTNDTLKQGMESTNRKLDKIIDIMLNKR